MNELERIRVPARRAKSVRLARGQTISIINTHGKQVVDTWAFNARNTTEFMSMEHSRVAMLNVTPRVNSTLVTNRRRGILMVVADTSPGVHDTLVAACDRYRYEMLGCKDLHDNCTDNLAAAMGEISAPLPETPCPLNLFQNSPVCENGRIEFRAPVSEAGQYIALRAEMDAIIVLSACPQDLFPLNGENCTPMDVHFTVI